MRELETQHDGGGSGHDLRSSKAATTGKGRSTRSGDHKPQDSSTHDDEIHRHRYVHALLMRTSSTDETADLLHRAALHSIIGGYKATLSREDRSEEAKEHAREALRALGEDV